MKHACPECLFYLSKFDVLFCGFATFSGSEHLTGSSTTISPVNFPYAEIQEATGNFSGKNVLGKGGFGTVFVARYSRMGGLVAVKVLQKVRRGLICIAIMIF